MQNVLTGELILYRNIPQGEILYKMTDILKDYTTNDQVLKDNRKEEFYECLNGLVENAGEYGFEGNLWHTYLTFLIVNHENAYSTACEIRGKVDGSINELALHDFTILKNLFDYPLGEVGDAFGVDVLKCIGDYQPSKGQGKAFNEEVKSKICALAKSLAKADSSEKFMSLVTEFYGEIGVGKFGLHKAFRIEHKEDGNAEIVPITNVPEVYMDDLVGYEISKKKLLDNTDAFIAGRKANNCLLFGDAGTGKSSSVKALMNLYYDRGLRIIEIYKHQFQDLNSVISQIKNRNYKFIIFMDDLSFEEFEVEYKYLKAVIEGGLEKKPENVLIYATSNRRHLIRETFRDKADRDEDMHTNDTVQEKLSLVARFGVQIYFPSPAKKEFQNIVLELAKKNKITIDEDELLLDANKWELNHGGFSGRCAQQFIDYLLGTEV